MAYDKKSDNTKIMISSSISDEDRKGCALLTSFIPLLNLFFLITNILSYIKSLHKIHLKFLTEIKPKGIYMNIQQAEQIIEKMEKEISNLREFIDQEKRIDIFKVTTYEEVCKKLKENPVTISYFAIDLKNIDKLVKLAKLDQVQRFFNQGWIPDWANTKEGKYYPFFKWNKTSGSLVFSGHAYCGEITYREVAFYQSHEISDHIGKYFSDLYI